MAFQQTVNKFSPIANAGDFASANPHVTYFAPEGGFVAGTGGIVIGTFVWIQSDGVTVLNTGTGKPDGFIHRENNAVITTYLADSGNTIPAGYPITVSTKGDYFAKATVAGATRNQKAFAKLADGTLQAAAAGATVSGFIETDYVITRTCLVNELTVITL